VETRSEKNREYRPDLFVAHSAPDHQIYILQKMDMPEPTALRGDDIRNPDLDAGAGRSESASEQERGHEVGQVGCMEVSSGPRFAAAASRMGTS